MVPPAYIPQIATFGSGANMQLSFPLIRRQSDDDNSDSLANKLRNRRFHLFEAYVAKLPRPLNILDVGGTNAFWEQRGWAGRRDVRVITVNLEAEPQRFDNVEPTVGDATNLGQFGNHSFDIVFSNSVIEHLFSLENQRKMASEIQRVGKAYWVQTPNFWFPAEPHCYVPAFLAMGLPVRARVALISTLEVWVESCPDLAGSGASPRACLQRFGCWTETKLSLYFRERGLFLNGSGDLSSRGLRWVVLQSSEEN